MSHLLPGAEQNPESQPQTFVLDYHTRQFVDPAYWEGAVEARFSFDKLGLEHREFVGRLVHFCGDAPVIAIREVGGEGDGATFVKHPPLGILIHQLGDPQSVAAFWAQWLSTQELPPASGCPLTVPSTSAISPSWGRLHYDVESGFGFIVSSHGYSTLVDLRDEESAMERNHVFMEFSHRSALSLSAWEMIDLSADVFHARMESLIRDPGSEAYQTLRFYKLGEDERSIEVFGCDYRTVKRALEALTLALTISLGPGGELAEGDRAHWHPWSEKPGKALCLHVGDRWWDDMPAPAKLGKLMGEICVAMGCRLRYEPMSERERRAMRQRGGKRIGEARMVALEWAGEFKVWSDSSSAHEAMEVAARLKETLETATIRLDDTGSP